MKAVFHKNTIPKPVRIVPSPGQMLAGSNLDISCVKWVHCTGLKFLSYLQR